MQAQQNIAQIQQKFVIQVDNQIAKIVAPADRQEIAKAYLQMFAGFALVNWTNKYSLGRAWQTALGQCGSFIESKGGKNPAAKHLANTYAGHKKQWSRVIMMHSARENTINPNDDKIKQLRAHGSKMIQAAMDKINLILARYNERVEELAAAQTKQAQPIQNRRLQNRWWHRPICHARWKNRRWHVHRSHRRHPSQTIARHSTRPSSVWNNKAHRPSWSCNRN